MFVGLLAGSAFGATSIFDSTTGLPGWTQVSGVIPGSLSDGVSSYGAIGLSTNTGYGDYEALTDLLMFTSNAGSDVGKFYTIAPDPQLVFQIEGSYVGIHYNAPAGQVITSVTIPNINYFDGYPAVAMQIADSLGTVATNIHAAGPIVISNFSATGLNTSSVELRLNSISGGQWGAAYWAGNYVSFDKVVVTTAAIPEPATMSLLGLGVLGLIRRKLA